MKHAATWIITTLSMAVIALAVTIGYLLWIQNKNNGQATVTSFETCATAGNPITQTSPRQCRDAKTGTTYTEPANQNQQQTPSTQTFASRGGVTIELNNWIDNKKVSSPLTVSGRVPGSWSFEASFPIELQTSDGRTLARTPATLTGDWMTTDLVPFTAVLTFDSATAGNTGKLILHKDNPSGLAEHDDSLELTVRYK